MAPVRWFVITVAALFISCGAILRFIDPRHDFGSNIFPSVVWDSRAEKMQIFSRYHADRPVQGLVLGSSRAMKLPPLVLYESSGLRFFNFAVENARAEDYLAIARWVGRQGAAPKVLIVSLDVEALHDNDEPDPAFARNRTLQEALTGHASILLSFWTYKRAFTPSYIDDAVKSVRLFFREDPRPLPYFAADGYLIDPELDQRRRGGTLNLERQITSCLPVYRRRYQDMTGLSRKRTGYLETLLAEAEAGGVHTVVWLTPLHPTTIQYLDARTRYHALLEELRAYLQTLARRPGVTAHDYSEPDRYGGTRAGWDDCAHVNPGQATLLAARLASDLR